MAHRAQMRPYCGRKEVEVIPHGVPIPDFVEAPAEKSVLAIGRMNARKGMETLLEAIPTVLARVPDATFRLVGVEEKHPSVQKFRAGHPGLSGVECPGMVDGITLAKMYDQCAVYVSPALYESFGLTFAEAMAHGRPVVGCATSAVPEIVRNGIDGVLVPPKDAQALAGAIIALLGDESLRGEMGAEARKRAVEHYSLERAAERVETWMGSALGS
jgi:glycosyltransferase involved in cell wall biosynthesis